MDSYDLKSLFDELLSQIREKRTRGTFRGIHWIPQSQLDEERKHENAMALEKQKSTGELEKQRLVESGATTRQGLVNTGQVEVEGVKNIGALARQRLMNESAANVENIKGGFDVKGHEIQAGAQRDVATTQAGAHKYSADKGLESHKVIAGATVEAAKVGAAVKRPTPSEIYLESAGQFFDQATYDNLLKRERQTSAPPLPTEDITATAKPAALPGATPNPARSGIADAVNNPQPAPAITLPRPRVTEDTSVPYDPNSRSWTGMQRSPAYIKYQADLQRKKDEEKVRRATEAREWNESLRNKALERLKNRPWAKF